MKLLPIQKEIINHPARFKCLIAGRRFSKTFIAMNSLVKYARFPGKKCMYVAPTYSMAKQIVWEDLKTMLRDRNWAKKINESELTITLVNGSRIFLRSADRFDNIRGMGLDYVVIDEAADIQEEAWKAVIRPTLSDRQGDALIIGTPKGRNWLYDVYNDAKHLDDWESWQKKTIDGGQVSAEELEQAKRDLDERTYKQEYEATFVEYSGLIYYAFGEHNIKDMEFGGENIQIPLHIGIDFNVDPGCAVIGFQHSKGIHIYDEIEIWGTDTQEMTSEIQRRYPNRKMFAYPDASGAQRRTSAGGITDHIILKNSGMTLRVGATNPSVKDRIASVNSVCKSQDGATKLTISPKCTKLINALRKHTYKEGTRQPEKDTGLDHFCDALGYLVNNLYPVRVDKINSYGKLVRKI